jgi:hypothetical protein
MAVCFAGLEFGITKDLLERAHALVNAGVDILALDSAHGDSARTSLRL